MPVADPRPGRGSVLATLADDLVGWLDKASDGVPRRVLLWLDPEGQFRRLARYLEPALAACGAVLLRADEGMYRSQVALKLELARRDALANEKVVVYLPGRRREALQPKDGEPPALWGVYEYRFRGCLWGEGERWEPGALPEPPSLLGWLTRHGLQPADPPTARELSAGGADSLLARYAERQRETDPSDWPRPLRVDDVRSALGGDPRENLRRLLAAPETALASWGDDRPLALAGLAAEYGLVLDAAQSADALADEAAIRLALAEAWDAFGGPSDFPYPDRLPERPAHRQKLAAFLRDEVLAHRHLAPRFYERIARLEARYDLTGWAAGRTGQPVGFPGLARVRWEEFLGRVDAALATGWPAARDLVLAERPTLDALAAGPWGQSEAESGAARWTLAARLADLLARSWAVANAVAGRGTPGALVEWYLAEGWQIDRLHREIRGSCAASPGLGGLARLADLAYLDAVSRENDRFAALVAGSKSWPPSGLESVASIRPALWGDSRARRAVMVIDALRWELAETLHASLDADATLAAIVSTLPTETPFGMTALLPLAGSLEIQLDAGPVAIRQGAGPDLATREGRKAFLAGALGGPKGKGIAFLDLADLSRGGSFPDAPLLVVFDNALDEAGHRAPEAFPAFAADYLGKLKVGIQRLLDAGYPTVHLVTDHGFLFLPPEDLDNLGHPEILPSQAFRKDFRWAALKPDAPVEGLLRLAPPLAPESSGFTLAFPRGVRTLLKAEAYLHGGISLQECVIPHLVVRRSLSRLRPGLDLTVPRSELSSGTITLILRPTLPGGQVPLGGIEPLRLEIFVETSSEAGQSVQRVTDAQKVQIRDDVDELRQALYLNEGIHLPAGQKLILRVLDEDTGRDYAGIQLTLLRDWE